MLRRPRSGETDEDLLRQEEELVARGQLRPSVKLVKADKRKTDDPPSAGVFPFRYYFGKAPSSVPYILPISSCRPYNSE